MRSRAAGALAAVAGGAARVGALGGGSGARTVPRVGAGSGALRSTLAVRGVSAGGAAAMTAEAGTWPGIDAGAAGGAGEADAPDVPDEAVAAGGVPPAAGAVSAGGAAAMGEPPAGTLSVVA
jgi:hypothetical protein